MLFIDMKINIVYEQGVEIKIHFRNCNNQHGIFILLHFTWA